MKEILKEYPIIKQNCTNELQLYRFPNLIKSFNPLEVKLKPTSKLTEIKVNFPSKCASALKLKSLSSENIAYRAFPTEAKLHYYAKVEDEKLLLFPIENIYLFMPFHYYYPFDYTPSKLKKAESREEFEHRMKSINFKLMNVELEGYRTFEFETNTLVPKTKINAVSQHIFKSKEIGKLIKINFEEIEETIRRTRIVNVKPLVELFNNEDAVKSTLFKMTEKLEGRFVLKNSFYEKNIRELRSRLLDLFKTQEQVKSTDVLFLKKEKWLIDEIATVKDGLYSLKGIKEAFEFDIESIKAANLSLIKELLKEQRILNIQQISTALLINEEVLEVLLKGDNTFFHLSNNSFALNDDSYILNSMFSLLVDKKSFEMSELEKKLEDQEIEYNESSLLNEIKKFCISRAGKFYIKTLK